MKPSEFFELENFKHAALFDEVDNVWDVLGRIKEYAILNAKPNTPPVGAEGVRVVKTTVVHEGKLHTSGLEIECESATKGKLRVLHKGKELPGAAVIYEDAILAGGPIEIGEGAVIESGAYIKGPAVIGARTEVRQGAYVRGGVITGTACVIGHATEVKNAVFLNDAKAGHFAYVGDSILGVDVNLGAGTKLANLRIVRGNIILRISGKSVDTGLRKFGAILGDGCETGCNSVTSPGTLFGPGSLIYPNTTAGSGLHPAGTILSQAKGAVVVRKRHK
jgi:bifunctional N-acetylglucosamine-1-phosphate-uridyltransferase/glucosamine-1-phosphate-acetyltransferase GlmU-like protein